MATVLTIGSSNQNSPTSLAIVTICSRHSDEHARLLCASEGRTGKGHVKGAHGGLAVQRGTNGMTLAILIFLSLCIDFATTNLLV